MTRPPDFDCSKCPGYCCTYPRIVVQPHDLRRLARHFALTPEQATRRFTTTYADGDVRERILRHRADPVYGSACRFLDRTTRRCSVYRARPDVCRGYPEGPHCGYYAFLTFERQHQGDPGFIPSA